MSAQVLVRLGDGGACRSASTGAEDSYGAEEHEGAEAHSTPAPPVFRRRACSRADTIQKAHSVRETCFTRGTRKQVLACCRSCLVAGFDFFVAGEGVKYSDTLTGA